jgi:hypothetical protein
MVAIGDGIKKGFLSDRHVGSGISAMITAGANWSSLLPSASHEVVPESLHVIPEPDVPDSQAAQVANDGLAPRILVAQHHIAVDRHD